MLFHKFRIVIGGTLMQILIFTQDKDLLSLMREETKQQLLTARLEAKMFSFHTLDSALHELSSNPSDFDIIVLDIDYAKDLKHIYSTFRIHDFLAAYILLSSSYKQLDAAMLLRPTAYLKKPFLQGHFRSRLRFLLQEYLSLDRYFNLTEKQKIESIPYKEIECFESNQRSITLHLRNNQSHTFPAKLSDIEHKLPPSSFIRCHQSYLVNMENIRLLDKTTKQLHMSSGRRVDISRRSISTVIEQFNLFLENKNKNR